MILLWVRRFSGLKKREKVTLMHLLNNNLILAIKKNHINTVKFLLIIGADVNSKDNEDNTALILAIQSGAIENQLNHKFFLTFQAIVSIKISILRK